MFNENQQYFDCSPSSVLLNKYAIDHNNRFFFLFNQSKYDPKEILSSFHQTRKKDDR